MLITSYNNNDEDSAAADADADDQDTSHLDFSAHISRLGLREVRHFLLPGLVQAQT